MGGALRESVSGVLLIDKPVGPSSNAVLQRVKHLLGASRAGHTGTLDPLARAEVMITRDELLAVLDRFRGKTEQLPPMHAAIKHRGRPLYAYARSGEHVPRVPRRIAIRRLELEEFTGDTAVLFVECSKGTY